VSSSWRRTPDTNWLEPAGDERDPRDSLKAVPC
jgi:hypothetical protein